MNEFCETIGIRYPIILGGMARVGTAPLAAAVSNAGGLGLLGSSAWGPEELARQIRQARQLTDKVFGVNIPVRAQHAPGLIAVVMEQKISVVATSAGDPGIWTRQLKNDGIFVMHVASTVERAVKAEQAGVDAVIAEGSESGGMTGPEEISTLVLVPQVTDAVKVPVVAAGGIGDGRGLAAALALGACAVQMGTAFIAAEECEISRAFKEILVMAKETDAVLIREDKMSRRVLNEAFVEEAVKMLAKHHPDIAKTLEAAPGSGTRGAGQIAGLVRKVRPTAAIIDDMMREAHAILPKIKSNLPEL
ncbi:MAG: nitronate monooxygenase [Deltaproteobacteria bacterium]|nr:nitronate monooxygenase [Deltaproteobacteria bacterium]